jgi:RES domain-containing protein
MASTANAITVYRIAQRQFINDKSGHGAYLYGGRWNSIGTHMLYTSTSISLAMLECLVHFTANTVPAHMWVLQITLPPIIIPIISHKQLPPNWHGTPAPIALKHMDDAFLQQGKSLALQVPSSIVPSEYNVLINPQHPLIHKAKFGIIKPISFDGRLL